MSVVDISHELELAMNSIESLLNAKDGDFILEAIRKYKQNKNIDIYTLMELRHRLRNI